MASLKEIRGRLVSVKGTLKITSAMRLISSAKLHSAQNAIGNMVPYEHNVQQMMLSLMGSDAAKKVLEPYTVGGTAGESATVGGESPKMAVILITSNQTLCGAFNVNIMKAFEAKNYDKENTVVYAVGKYGMKAAMKEGYNVVDCCNMAAHADYDKTVAMSKDFVERFLSGELSKVEMVYAHFASPVSQPIVCENYLPMKVEEDLAEDNAAESDLGEDYIVEPSAEKLLESMLPMVLRLKLHTVMLDSTAAEHAARTLAMQMASENAEELIGELSLQYNKLRQQAITNEILNLLGGQANN